jgi:hypothetical protein
MLLVTQTLEQPLSWVDRARLAPEILTTYLRVRRALPREQLPALVTALRDRPTPGWTVGPMRDAADGERLGRAVDRMLNLLPVEALCLTRSLVLLRLLARRGTRASLVIAAPPGTAPQFIAHAWVEHEGRPLLDPGSEDLGRLLTL